MVSHRPSVARWSLSDGNLLGLQVTQGKGYYLRFLDWGLEGLGGGVGQARALLWVVPLGTPPPSLPPAGAYVRLTQRRGSPFILPGGFSLWVDSLYFFLFLFFFCNFFASIASVLYLAWGTFHCFFRALTFPWWSSTHKDLKTQGSSFTFLLFSLPPLGLGDTGNFILQPKRYQIVGIPSTTSGPLGSYCLDWKKKSFPYFSSRPSPDFGITGCRVRGSAVC